MKSSIYFRNFVATALIVLTGFLLLGGLSTAWSYRVSLAEKREAMSSTLRETRRYATAQSHYYGFDLSDLTLNMWLSMISGVSGFELMLADADGVIASCSNFEHLGKTIPEEALSVAVKREYAVLRSTLGGIYPEVRHVAGAPLTVPINGRMHIFGYLFLSSDAAAFRESWEQFLSIFTPVALFVMALTFIITFLTTKKQAEPINEMAAAARRFARGDFNARVEDTGRLDEIGQLTQAFNAMADSIESAETLRREFVANISHELKTPMTVIAGFADGLLDGTIPLENEARYLGVISSETRRLSRLVAGMLDMSKLQSADTAEILKNSFDITEVARLALLSLGGKIDDKRLDIKAELPEEAVFTRGDKDAVTQVVYNLIDNAIKFSAQGGTVGLELWKQGGKAYVSVQNRGETIPPAELPYIFERFHKSDRSRSADRDGVGLGLYIVKTILDNHNEDIFVTSSDGVTKFVFSLTVA